MSQLTYRTGLRRVVNATTSSGAQTGTPVDMANFQGVRFLALFGAATTLAPTLRAQMAASTTATFVYVAGATVTLTTGANVGLALDVYRPRKRFVRPVISAGAFAKNGVVAESYSPRKLSTTTLDHATFAARAVVSGASSG